MSQFGQPSQIKKLFNINNSGNLTGKYPLFMGEEPGLFDSANVTYPEIFSMHRKHLQQIWMPEDQRFDNDRLDMLKVKQSSREIMTETLAYQLATDSLVSVSVQQMLSPFITNPEFKEFVSYWNLDEDFHARTYARIIETVYTDPSEMYETIKRNEPVLKRLTTVFVPIFEETVRMGAEYTLGILTADNPKHVRKIKKQLLKTIAVIALLEGISFTSSFASTWALAEAEQAFNGISKSVTLIANDELLHAKMDLYVLLTMINKEGYADLWEEIKPEVQDIFNLGIQLEFEWADWLLSGDRKIPGFTAPLLKRYVAFIATPYYLHMGLEPVGFSLTTDNVFASWIEAYQKPDLVAVALQETQSGNYAVAALELDVEEGETFEDMI